MRSLLCLALSCLWLASVAETMAQAHLAEAPVDEIEVVGQRLDKLRIEITNARLDIYTLYNSLNVDDEFDVHCRLRKTTGSLIKERICVAQFVDDALEDSAAAAFVGIGIEGRLVARRPRGLTPLIQGEIAVKNRLLADRMVELAAAHPELSSAIFDLDALMDEYVAATDTCSEPDC